MPASRSPIPTIPRTETEISEFLLRACHDLRGPIRSIKTHAELLARSDPSGAAEEDRRQALQFILSGTSLAGALLDGLTDYSLALEIDPSTFLPVPMGVMLRAALAKLAAELKTNDGEVTYGTLPTIPGDADRLMQLFEYLLDHAIRHRGPGRLKVHVSAEEHSSGWQFAVRDNGTALEADLLERAFAPFERLQGNDRPGPGLAVCRVIVERHGGKIWAEGNADAGTSFCFTIPAE